MKIKVAGYEIDVDLDVGVKNITQEEKKAFNLGMVAFDKPED